MKTINYSFRCKFPFVSLVARCKSELNKNLYEWRNDRRVVGQNTADDIRSAVVVSNEIEPDVLREPKQLLVS